MSSIRQQARKVRGLEIMANISKNPVYVAEYLKEHKKAIDNRKNKFDYES